MADTLQDLQAEKTRLHGSQFNGISVLLDASRMILKIKDSRSTERGGDPRDINQALLMHGFTPSSWHEYSVEQSRATFV